MDRGNTIGSRIEHLRKTNGLTQAELAKEMGVKRETIVQWESNTRDLKTEATIKLADFFGVTCDELLRGIKSENVDINKRLGLSDEAIQALEMANNRGIEVIHRPTFEVKNSVFCNEIISDLLSSEFFLDSLMLLCQIKIDISRQKKQGLSREQINQAKNEASKILGESVELLIGYDKIHHDFQKGIGLLDECVKDITGYSVYERDHHNHLMSVAMESGGL